MTIETWLREATNRLQAGGIETARLDCLVLLEDAFLAADLVAETPLYTNRAQILAHLDAELTAEQQELLNKQVTRRLTHEPLAYIRGKAEFYGREFVVGPAVLVPRPESEAMIELLKDLVATDAHLQALLPANSPKQRDMPTHTAPVDANGSSDPPTQGPKPGQNDQKYLTRQLTPSLHIADIGTGSGALGVTAALELPTTQVDLLEIDPAAIEIAKINANRHRLDIPVIESDLLANAPQTYDILLCNLPYVPDNYAINTAAQHEPKLALFAGSDGLDLYRRLFQQIKNMPAKPYLILTESLPLQHAELGELAKQFGYHEARKMDFIQAFCLEK